MLLNQLKKLKKIIFKISSNILKGFLGIIFFNFQKNKCQVFLYHEISNNPSNFAKENDLNVNPIIFEKQICWINRNYNIIDPLELLDKESLVNKNNKRPKALITFDDGSLSILKNAAPILRKFDLKALFFLNMKPIEGGYFWAGMIQYLLNNDKNFKKEMQKKYNYDTNLFLYIKEKDLNYLNYDMKTIKFKNKLKEYYGLFANKARLKEYSDVLIYGSHLYDHHNAANLEENDLKFQLKKNKESLESINGYCEFFSYPFGQPITCFNKKTDKIIFSTGVKKIFYSEGKSNLSFNSRTLNRISPTESFNLGYMKYIISKSFLKSLMKSRNKL